MKVDDPAHYGHLALRNEALAFLRTSKPARRALAITRVVGGFGLTLLGLALLGLTFDLSLPAAVELPIIGVAAACIVLGLIVVNG